MARMSVLMPDDFMNKVSKLDTMTDKIVEDALEAGGQVVLNQVRGTLSGAVASGTKFPSKSTGELRASLGVTPVKKDSVGSANLKVGFNEPRRDQSGGTGKNGKKRSYKKRTNAMIASVLEHGRHGQPPRPFMAPARAASESACVEVMKSTIESAVNSL